MSFLEELVKSGLLREDQIVEVKNLAREKYEGNIDSALIAMGISEENVLDIKGKHFIMPVKKIDPKNTGFEVLKYIPEDSARHYHFVPLEQVDGVLEIGIVDPEYVQALDALQFISTKLGIPFKLFLISKSAYEGVLANYKGVSTQVTEALNQLNQDEALDAKSLNEALETADSSKGSKKANQNEKIVEDAPIIKIVAVILRNAVEGNASDIHIEHTGKTIKVRYRLDGTLYPTIMLPINVHSGIVARVKILSRLRLDEKRKPQDGSFSANIGGRNIDFRVSTMPGYYGEKVEIRVLDSEKGVKKLDQLGLSDVNLQMVRDSINRSYGLILITGPTGSGKSTTLYSMMNELEKEKSNIITLEDPIEYHMADINQSQVVPEIGYTFASGLRSILRQDPDIIMVGEIRDKETAQLAIQAALTGHLVFSTLHTNDAIGAIPRLIDMGVDPYLIAPTLVLAVAQRLAKTTHPSSRKLVPMDKSIKMQIEAQLQDFPDEFRKKIVIKDEMYDTVPSPESPTGTKGRIAIFEMFQIGAEIQNIILTNPVYSEIYKVARRKGMLLMKEDAMLKAIDGIIPYKEVYNFNTGQE